MAVRRRLHARRHAQVCSAAALAEGPGPAPTPVARPRSPAEELGTRCEGSLPCPEGSRGCRARRARADEDRGAQRALRKGRHRRVLLPAPRGRGRLRLPGGSTDGVRRPRCPCEPTGCMRGNTCVCLHGLAGLHVPLPHGARAGLRPRFALVVLRHDAGGERCGSGGVA